MKVCFEPESLALESSVAEGDLELLNLQAWVCIPHVSSAGNGTQGFLLGKLSC